MLAGITILEDSLALQQQEGGDATQATADHHQMPETGSPEDIGFSAEVKTAPAKPMETEETAAGETPNEEEATDKGAPVEEVTPDKEAAPDEETTAGEEEERPFEEPAETEPAMDSDAPDKMLRAAAVHDEAGRSAGLVDWRRQAGRGLSLSSTGTLTPSDSSRQSRSSSKSSFRS